MWYDGWIWQLWITTRFGCQWEAELADQEGDGHEEARSHKEPELPATEPAFGQTVLILWVSHIPLGQACSHTPINPILPVLLLQFLLPTPHDDSPSLTSSYGIHNHPIVLIICEEFQRCCSKYYRYNPGSVVVLFQQVVSIILTMHICR